VAENDPNAATAKKSGSKLLLICIVAGLLTATGGWIVKTRLARRTAQAGAPTRVESVLHLETFVLNLPDANSRCYLRIGVDVGLARREESKAESSAPAVPMVRDTILNVLSTANADEMMTAEGKQKLKAALVRALQQRVPELQVQEVYFTELLIQR
jgi:flagellar FliL protein